MFGKIFDSLYTGSLIGAGGTVFAVWGYVIANQEPDKKVGSQVDLNPKLLAAIIGDPEKDIVKAIEKLCAPDPDSRSKEKGGRRLVKLGQFSYQVVNGAKYRAIRDQEARREQNREAQRRLRSGTPAPGERLFVKVYGDEGPEAAEKLLDASTGQPEAEETVLDRQ